MRAIQLQLWAHVLAHDDVTPRMSATIYVNKKCLELSDPFPSPLRLVKGLACETTILPTELCRRYCFVASYEEVGQETSFSSDPGWYHGGEPLFMERLFGRD